MAVPAGGCGNGSRPTASRIGSLRRSLPPCSRRRGRADHRASREAIEATTVFRDNRAGDGARRRRSDFDHDRDGAARAVDDFFNRSSRRRSARLGR